MIKPENGMMPKNGNAMTPVTLPRSASGITCRLIEPEMASVEESENPKTSTAAKMSGSLTGLLSVYPNASIASAVQPNPSMAALVRFKCLPGPATASGIAPSQAAPITVQRVAAVSCNTAMSGR